jgi:general secretion pathway protein F
MLRTVQETAPGGAVSLEELRALNDEIAALSRAGLPLERGLLDAGRDLPRRLHQVMESLGERMKQGESLAEAIESEGERLPRVYKAVVEAGLRSGRLPSALESMGGFVGGYVDARRAIGLALWYPLIVLVLAYSLLVFLVVVLLPRFLDAFESLWLGHDYHLRLFSTGLGFTFRTEKAAEWLRMIGDSVTYWGLILPALLVLGVAWWVRSGRASGFQPGRGWRLIRWFPWMNGMLAQFETANFADMLALLLEQRVPYPQALTLAADATGDPRLVRACGDLAGAIERGAPPQTALTDARAFPPLLRWLLATGTQQAMLVSALRNVGEMYRKRALFRAEKIRVYMPILLLLGVGGLATLFFGLSLFVPFSAILRNLAIPAN